MSESLQRSKTGRHNWSNVRATVRIMVLRSTRSIRILPVVLITTGRSF